MSLGSTIQDDFSRGIVRSVEGQRIPNDGMYDCINGLLDDDLGVYRRGGSSYLISSNGPSGLIGLWTGLLGAGERTVAWNTSEIQVLNGGVLQTFGVESGTDPGAPASRPVSLAGYLLLQSAGTVNAYAGGLSATDSYSTGTATLTGDNVLVTGSGTAWLANVAAGMILQYGNRYGIVVSVEDDTHLTLKDPWTGPSAPGVAVAFSPYHAVISNVANVDALGVAGNRLLLGSENRVYMTPPVTSSSAEFQVSLTEEFHLLPEAAQIIALEGMGDFCWVFTTAGIFRISNLAYDLTDAYGNPQQQVAHANKDLVLWGEGGLAVYRGGIVVPGLDDVYLLGADGGLVPVAGPILPLYRSYLRAGYQPGQATVFRNHYVLPIVAPSDLDTPVDVLVCRLDGETPAWTRWAGHAAGVGYAARVGSSSRTPDLYGVQGARLTSLAGCFSPSTVIDTGVGLSSNKNDADGTTHVLTVVTRDFAIKAQVANLWKYLRARFELVDAASDNPTLTAEYAVGPPESESWTSMGSWSEGTGETSTKLSVGKRAQSIRFRLKTSGPSSRFRLRSLEVFFRPRNRL